MLVFRQVKSFINCFSIYQIEFLFKFFGIFIIIIFLFICQIFGIIEVIPSVHAISLIEGSVDESAPLQLIGTEDSFSAQRNESNFYEETAEEQEEIILNEIPATLPERPAQITRSNYFDQITKEEIENYINELLEFLSHSS